MKRAPLRARRQPTPHQKARIIERQNGLCACGCREALGTDPRDIQFDHVHEIWEGGGNDLDNFAALKRRHHLAKTVRKTKERAKCDRLAALGGRRKMTAAERELARILKR